MSTERPTAEEIQEAAKLLPVIFGNTSLMKMFIFHAQTYAESEVNEPVTPRTVGYLVVDFVKWRRDAIDELVAKEAEQLV